MKLNDFINHMKHNSVAINIFGYESSKVYFLGDVGGFKTSVIKSTIGDWKIGKIEPIPMDALNIFIHDEISEADVKHALGDISYHDYLEKTMKKLNNEYFKALVKIKKEFGCDPAYYGLGGEFEILNMALTELKAIKEANPSEAMKCLEKLDDMFYMNGVREIASGVYEPHELSISETKEYDTINQSLLKAQEKENTEANVKKVLSQYYNNECDAENTLAIINEMFH